MKRRTLIASIGAVAGTTLGAAAYTSTTVSRSATISIASDDSALITLAPGSFEQISQNTDGDLGINFTSLNGNSTFTFGDTNDAVTTHAFSLTNADTASHDLSLAYNFDGTGDPDANTKNLEFEIYDDTGAAVSIVDEDTDQSLAGVATGTTYYVILHIDTTGLGTSSDLSGELTISGSADSTTTA